MPVTEAMDSKKTIKGYAGPYRGKNDYYRDGAHTLMFIINFQAVIMVLLAITLSIYLCTRQSHDRFFAEIADNKVMQMQSYDLPNMSKVTLGKWIATAASEIMTFGFNDADVRFAQSKNNFTPAGWESFRKAVILSKLAEEIAATQQIATAVPLSPPTLKGPYLINGTGSWVADVPLLITFRAGGDIRPIVKTVHMVIERVPTWENPTGVGISEWDIN